MLADLVAMLAVLFADFVAVLAILFADFVAVQVPVVDDVVGTTCPGMSCLRPYGVCIPLCGAVFTLHCMRKAII